MHVGSQEKLFSWPWEGQEFQQNLDHTEAESEIVVIWNPGKFQECWTQEGIDHDSGVPLFS